VCVNTTQSSIVVGQSSSSTTPSNSTNTTSGSGATGTSSASGISTNLVAMTGFAGMAVLFAVAMTL
jgi:hypothetical protein